MLGDDLPLEFVQLVQQLHGHVVEFLVSLALCIGHVDHLL
nr:MAG TPA: hypothetical protein [Caudoviricetes sp.]